MFSLYLNKSLLLEFIAFGIFLKYRIWKRKSQINNEIKQLLKTQSLLAWYAKNCHIQRDCVQMQHSITFRDDQTCVNIVSKQKELETMVKLGKYDLIAIIKTW